ncbi:MAG: acyl-CoA synthetase [Candidatus Bathyarchaeia archaeon]
MTFTEKYGPPRSLWPKFCMDFPEAQQWPSKINAAEFLVDRQVKMGKGGNTAILYRERRITFEELQRMSNSFGNALKSLGVGAGDRVMIGLPNIPEFIISELAALKLGAICVLIHPLWRAREICYIAEDSEAAVFITNSKVLMEVERAGAPMKTMKHIILVDGSGGAHLAFEDLMNQFKHADSLDPVMVDFDETAFLQYTSGTTGPPKGCMHTHGAYLVAGECFARKILASSERDVWGGPVSIVFSFGHHAFIADPFYNGSASSLYGEGKFDPAYMFELIEEHRITILCAVPTAYRIMVAQTGMRGKYDFSSLRVCVTGGEHCPALLHNKIREFFGCEVLNHIGCTEMHNAFISERFDRVNPGSLGIPVPGYTVRVVDDSGKDLPPGEIGHLAVIGPTGTRYWKKLDKQAESVRDGWNYTGDMIYMDEKGYFWYVSRSDDIIKTSAYRVQPHEIEEALLSHPAVSEVAVVGVPDAERGQAIAAFIVLKNAYQPSDMLKDELRNHVKAHIAPYKVPKLIEFTRDLPKTETGKIKRSELRKRFTGES